jgi:hypothetical protein
LVKLEDETLLGNNTVAKNPIRKIDRKSKAIQFENCEKRIENEVSRIRNVTQWKANTERGQISGENQSQHIILKL